jgi:hypothetical protein
MGADAAGRLEPEDVELEDDGGSGRYMLRLGGLEAEMTFTRERGAGGATVMRIDHTGVPKRLEGRGVGATLVKRAILDARAQGFRILPACSFVRAQFKRHPEWSDLLA